MPASPVTPQELAAAEALVRRQFGFGALKGGQAETIARATRGEDVLAILPTGGGKSVCYQVLPAVVKDGLILVVSPLLALMKDQLDALPPHMRTAAASLTSDLTASGQRAVLEDVARGRVRLLYVAPERLRDPRLARALASVGVARFVVDEAHCIASWGHDFRPEYLALADARRKLGAPPLLALTATASPRVAREVVERLEAPAMAVVRASPARPNLRLEAIEARDADEKMARLLQLCRDEKGPGIVYASSRAKTEQIAAALQRAGLRAEAYHAGMPDRAARQDAFLANEYEIMVATVAFGMGVDKSDVRFVFHHDPSGSLEAYWQEAGRAGRDGLPARCVLLHTRADASTLKQRARADLPTRALVGEVWRLLVETLHEDRTALLDPALVDKLDADDHKPRVALRMLEEAGAIERVEPTEAQAGLLVYKVLGDTSRVEEVIEAYAARAAARVDEILAYARATDCRHARIRSFFGEEDVPPRCTACDSCLALEPAPLAAASGDDEDASARAVLEALASVRGVGEVNLLYMLRGDARAADWLAGKPGFGALAHRSESKVRALVRALEAQGLVARETLAHGGSALRISASGQDALSRDLPIQARGASEGGGSRRRSQASEPLRAPTLRVPDLGVPAEEDPLFAALKQWRRRVADEQGLPPYVVAHDATLRSIAAARPGSLAALRAVKGMGPKKVEAYGEAILALVSGKPQA